MALAQDLYRLLPGNLLKTALGCRVAFTGEVILPGDRTPLLAVLLYVGAGPDLLEVVLE